MYKLSTAIAFGNKGLRIMSRQAGTRRACIRHGLRSFDHACGETSFRDRTPKRLARCARRCGSRCSCSSARHWLEKISADAAFPRNQGPCAMESSMATCRAATQGGGRFRRKPLVQAVSAVGRDRGLISCGGRRALSIWRARRAKRAAFWIRSGQRDRSSFAALVFVRFPSCSSNGVSFEIIFGVGLVLPSA